MLLYRIENEKSPYSTHLVPDEGIKGITTAINNEVDRLFYLWKKLKQHHDKNPTSKIFGISREEEDILQKIKDGYYEKKIKELSNKSIKKRKEVKKKIVNSLPTNLKKAASTLLKVSWHRKENLTEGQIKLLRKVGYQESDGSHKVYDFEGRLVGCFGYKDGGFRSGKNYKDIRESLHHFSRPFLLKELSPSTKILESIELGNNKRRIVDAVLTAYEGDKEIKIAVEFQESHRISEEEIKGKLTPLIEKFGKVIIVCSTDFRYLYDNFISDKVFVLNNSEFIQFLQRAGLLESSSRQK